MSPGERQFYLLLASKGSATLVEEEGKRYYVIDEDAQQCLVGPLSARPLPLRAQARGPEKPNARTREGTQRRLTNRLK